MQLTFSINGCQSRCQTRCSRIEHSPNRVSNVTVIDCVRWAYGAREDQITGDNRLRNEHYDIIAKAASAVPENQLKIMLQDLLAKRFKLVLRRETKMIPVYELIVTKQGPKLPPPKPESESSPVHTVENLPRIQDGSFVFRESSLAEFADKLSMLRGVDRPVVDRTGIKGYFDITLKGAASAILQENGPSLAGMVEEQLGLKLVAAKSAVELLVIDHAEKPSAN
jgi:uncharacterized protein (TIGR03435 family)